MSEKEEVSTKMQILGQFIKDLSFENIAAQEVNKELEHQILR